MVTQPPSSSNLPSDTDSGFAGTLKNIQLNDLIQMCCLSASSLCMRVTKGKRLGTIFIVGGEIIHAACEDVEGEEAFYRILGWQTGSFESIEMSTTPERTIQKNYHFLVMEAARRLDEQIQSESDPSECPPDPTTDAAGNLLRVLIVDDSPLMRKILSSMLTTNSQIKVVGTASNGKEAIAMIDDLSPDLVTLDVNMPVMDGTSTIKHIMIKKPCPVVITSNPGHGSSKTIFNFFELGAVDFISKPTKNQDILAQQQNILKRIKIAARAKVGKFRIARMPVAKSDDSAVKAVDCACRRLVIVISGPGGHPEQMTLLSGLVPAMADVAGAVVALQSLPPSFGEAFASYLVERCGCPAVPINEKIPIAAGQCYVGINGSPLAVQVNYCQPMITPTSAENGLAPVDRFLISAASAFKADLAVVLLSGADSGEQLGLQTVREHGGRIILHKRTSAMVSEPLDKVVATGLADKEVNLVDLVKTVVN
jgi:two-component system chemotaxis response regulator CheB